MPSAYPLRATSAATFLGPKCAAELFQYRASRSLGPRRRRLQLVSSHFHLLENLCDLSGRAVFRERFPISHPLVPIGILTGRGWELATLQFVSENAFLELPDDNTIRPAHLHNHGLILIAPIPRIRNSGLLIPGNAGASQRLACPFRRPRRNRVATKSETRCRLDFATKHK